MPRASRPQHFRPSDVIRISANGKGRTGRRAVVVSREVFDATTKVFFRGLVKSSNGEHISETVEGFTSLSSLILHAIEGVWEGELAAGSPGRTVMYNDQAFVASEPRPARKRTQKGEANVPTRTAGKGKTKPAAKKVAKPAANARAERATEAALDRDAAKVVKMRDTQGKAWGDIAEALDIAPSRLRALYNRGGGAPTATKGAAKSKPKAKPAARGGAKAKTGAAKPAARGRGKRNPS